VPKGGPDGGTAGEAEALSCAPIVISQHFSISSTALSTTPEKAKTAQEQKDREER